MENKGKWMKMNEFQALIECVELWCLLADSARSEQDFDKHDIKGPWQKYQCNCPCCECINHDLYSMGIMSLGDACRFCPMFDQWMYYYNPTNDKDVRRNGQHPCMYEKSPYKQWSNVIEKTHGKKMLWYDLEFFCLLIAELAREALHTYLPKVQGKISEGN